MTSSNEPELEKLFEKYIKESMDELPAEYIENLNNVAITTQVEPTANQAQQLKLRSNSLLFGLYEGIPLSKRGTGATMALPDKITLFINPLLAVSRSKPELKQNIKRTLWHEIAHFYGLDHQAIDKLQSK